MSDNNRFARPLVSGITGLLAAIALGACAGRGGDVEVPPEPVAYQPPATAAPAPAARRVEAEPTGRDIALNPRHPDRYVVQRGDTLWDISTKFLRDAWLWPEIWYVNPQVRNPHLIYPGDVLTLVWIDGRPRIQLERDGSAVSRSGDRLSPRIREQSLEDAIPTIPYAAIAPFLSRPTVLDKDVIKGLPYILSTKGHLIAGAGYEVYVRGLDDTRPGIRYNVLHIGDPLRDPDNNDLLGYEGLWVGEGSVQRTGDPVTMLLTKTEREALEGDRLIAVEESPVALNFYPHAPDEDIDGNIISVLDAVSRVGQFQIVVLNRGARHGVDQGTVMSVFQPGEVVRDRIGGGLISRKVKLPDEHVGEVMVFRSFDNISYALVMKATNAIRNLDAVRNPQ